MELLKELKKYNEDLTIKEVVAQIAEKETENNKICQKFKGKYLRVIDKCEFFGDLLQVIKVDNVSVYKGGYKLHGESVCIRDVSIYTNDITTYLYLAEDLEKMEVITENEYKVYVALHDSVKQQLSMIWKN